MKLLSLLVSTVILLSHPSIGMNKPNTRAMKACLSCRINKTKCDGLMPCKKCKDSELSCRYPLSLKRGRKPKNYKRQYMDSAAYPTYNFINGRLEKANTERIIIFDDEEILPENYKAVMENPPENQAVRENPVDDYDRFRVYSEHNFPELSKIFGCSTDLRNQPQN